MMLASTVLAGHISPVFLMRAAAMDLGFDGLIDKIDERFGRLVTNLLLLALIFLIFGWAINALLGLYVSGVKLWEGGGADAIVGFLKISAVFIFLCFASAFVIYAFWCRKKTRSVNQVAEYASAIADKEIKKAESTLRRESERHVSEIKDLASKTLASAKETLGNFTEIARRRKEQLDQQEVEVEKAKAELKKMKENG